MTRGLFSKSGASSVQPIAKARSGQMIYLKSFLSTPLAWVLIMIMVGSISAEAHYREGNRLACAAVSMLLDRQIWREVIAGPGRSEIRVFRACLNHATPITYDMTNIPPLSKVRRISDGLP